MRANSFQIDRARKRGKPREKLFNVYGSHQLSSIDLSSEPSRFEFHSVNNPSLDAAFESITADLKRNFNTN